MAPSVELQKIIESTTRTAFIPVFDENSAEARGSRYFGDPWMNDDVSWPTFNGDPMNFVLQLDLATIPEIEGFPRKGLLSLFNSEEWKDDNSHAKGFIFDLDRPGDIRLGEDVDRPDPIGISKWKEVQEQPCASSFWEEGYDPEAHPLMAFEEELEDVRSDTIGEVLTKDGKMISEKVQIETSAPTHFHCYMCDKLGGWPDFVQAPEVPSDSNGDPMMMVMQVAYDGGMLLGLDKEMNNDLVTGRGHIYHSPKTGEIAFPWAC